MKNIHILPTDKPSRLVKFFTNKFHLCKEILPIQDEEQYQNISITNDEDIKEGDWCIHSTTLNISKHHSKDNNLTQGWKKIILTTDQDLIKDGVQAILEEFLEWLILNPSCEEVEIIIEQYTQNYHKDIWYNKYKIIIPKEEPEQETLEEVAERFANECNSYDAKLIADGVEFGAKWQQERSYSEEEVNEIISASWLACEDNEGETFTQARARILEQFKKK